MQPTAIFALAIAHWPVSKAQEVAAAHAAIRYDTVPCPPPEDCEGYESWSNEAANTEYDLSPTLPSGPRLDRVTAVLPAPRDSEDGPCPKCEGGCFCVCEACHGNDVWEQGELSVCEVCDGEGEVDCYECEGTGEIE